MELSAIIPAITAVIGVIVSLCVGLGAFGAAEAKLIVSTAGSLVSIVAPLIYMLVVKTKVTAAIGAKDMTTLRRIAGR